MFPLGSLTWALPLSFRQLPRSISLFKIRQVADAGADRADLSFDTSPRTENQHVAVVKSVRPEQSKPVLSLSKGVKRTFARGSPVSKKITDKERWTSLAGFTCTLLQWMSPRPPNRTSVERHYTPATQWSQWNSSNSLIHSRLVTFHR